MEPIRPSVWRSASRNTARKVSAVRMELVVVSIGATMPVTTGARMPVTTDGGRLTPEQTLTIVSDEETGGRWGSGYLVEHHPELLGDCVLNGEPSSRYTVRFGEKGMFWLRFRVKTPGAHGAYPHLSASATKIAARLVLDLEKDCVGACRQGVREKERRDVATCEEVATRGLEHAVGELDVAAGRDHEEPDFHGAPSHA